MNQIVIMGRLTADPELKETTSGKSVTSFSVAVQRDFARDETDFIPIVAWRKTAEFITKYFMRGQLIVLVGRLQSRKYEDKQGNKRTAYEVIADRAYFAGRKEHVPFDNHAGQDDVMIDPSDYVEVEDVAKLPF